MGLFLSRFVKIQICNRTRNFTLKNPSIYFNCGSCYDPPLPEVLPGSSDICKLLGTFPFWGVAGVLVYEAESFTLANPVYYSMELDLELSPSKVHQNRLEDTYTRMAKGRSSSSSDTTTHCIVLGKNHGSAQVSNGPVKVMVTISNDLAAVLRVVLEEQEGSGQEAEIEVPSPGRHVQEK